MGCCIITGANGFVGSNVARRFVSRGWHVRCLIRDTSQTELLDDQNVEIVRGSLFDPNELRRKVSGADVAIHIAGRVKAFTAQEFQRDNVDATRNFVQACASQENPPKLVNLSSLAAGGTGVMEQPRMEQQLPSPVSAYGRSKLAAEQAVSEFASDVPITIIRPPIIFGPADRASLTMYRGFQRLPIHANPGFRQFPVSLIYVADLAHAIELAADNGERVSKRPDAGDGSTDGIYYVCAERDLTYSEFGRLAGQAAGLRIWPVPTPKTLFWIVGAAVEGVGRMRGRPGLINLDKVREATAAGWVCSSEKIQRDLGFAVARPLEERFAETVAWYREHKWL